MSDPRRTALRYRDPWPRTAAYSLPMSEREILCGTLHLLHRCPHSSCNGRGRTSDWLTLGQIACAAVDFEFSAQSAVHHRRLPKARQKIDRHLVAAPHCAQHHVLVATTRVGEAFWLASAQLGLGPPGPKRSVYCSDGYLAGCLVGCLVDCSDDCSDGCLAGCLAGCLVGWLVVWLVVWLVDYSDDLLWHACCQLSRR